MNDNLTISIDADTTGFERALQVLDEQAEQFGNTLTRALKGAVVSGKSLEDVLRGIAMSFASQALTTGLAPLQSILNGLGSRLVGTFAPVLPFAQGGVLSAAGGVVGTPTYFPTPSGIGVMGEAGAEAILPLRRGSDGNLGVVSNTAPTSPTRVIVNITTPDATSFKRSEQQVSAALARAVARGQRTN